jgi:hypothetical protein
MTNKEFNKELLKLIGKDRSKYYINSDKITELLKNYIFNKINEQEDKFDKQYITDFNNLILLAVNKVIENGQYKYIIVDKRYVLKDIYLCINQEIISTIIGSDLIIETEHHYLYILLGSLDLF